MKKWGSSNNCQHVLYRYFPEPMGIAITYSVILYSYIYDTLLTNHLHQPWRESKDTKLDMLVMTRNTLSPHALFLNFVSDT